MKMLRQFAVFILLSFTINLAYANSSPVTLLQQLSNQMIAQLQTKKLVIAKDPSAVHRLVRSILLPHVDMNKMSQAVLGPEWNKASAAQRSEFVSRFTTILVRTYSAALAEYNNEKVEFLPLRDGNANKKEMRVDSRILRQGGPAIPVSYRVALNGSQWKVYDLSVDGVSLIQNYRSQFSSILHSQGGLNGLLKTMSKQS